MHICIYECMYICIPVDVYICICAYVYVHVYMCICVYVCVYLFKTVSSSWLSYNAALYGFRQGSKHLFLGVLACAVLRLRAHCLLSLQWA